MTASGASGIAWRAWPLKRQPARGALAGVVVVMSCWGVWSWTASTWLTGLAVVVLAVSVGPFFLPTRYRLGPEGVEVVRRPWPRKTRKWTEFRAVRAGGDLVLLSPSERRSWLDNIRGEMLHLEDNREEVLGYVREMVDTSTGSGSA